MDELKKALENAKKHCDSVPDEKCEKGECEFYDFCMKHFMIVEYRD